MHINCCTETIISGLCETELCMEHIILEIITSTDGAVTTAVTVVKVTPICVCKIVEMLFSAAVL